MRASVAVWILATSCSLKTALRLFFSQGRMSELVKGMTFGAMVRMACWIKSASLSKGSEAADGSASTTPNIGAVRMAVVFEYFRESKDSAERIPCCRAKEIRSDTHYNHDRYYHQ